MLGKEQGWWVKGTYANPEMFLGWTPDPDEDPLSWASLTKQFTNTGEAQAAGWQNAPILVGEWFAAATNSPAPIITQNTKPEYTMP